MTEETKCNFCEDPCPFVLWDDARAAGWRCTTWSNPPDDHAVFCPDCWAQRDGEDQMPW